MAEYTAQLKKFSLGVQGESVFPPIPKRKGPFIRKVIEDFEAKGYVWSNTGMSAHIVMAWCRVRRYRFEMRYEPKFGYWVWRRDWTKDIPEKPGYYWAKDGESIALRYLHFSHKAPGLIGYEVTLSNWTSKTAFIPVADAYLEYIGPITQSDL